jgi:hypothetical protein
MQGLRALLPALLAGVLAACSAGAAVPPSSMLTGQSTQFPLSLDPASGAKPGAHETDGCPQLKTHPHYKDEHLEAAKIVTDAIPSAPGVEFICIYQNKIDPIQSHRLPDNQFITYANPKYWTLRDRAYHCENLSNCFFEKKNGQPPGQDTTVTCPSIRNQTFNSVYIASEDIPTDYAVHYYCVYVGHGVPGEKLEVKLKEDEYISRLLHPQRWWGRWGCDANPDGCEFVVTKVKGA